LNTWFRASLQPNSACKVAPSDLEKLGTIHDLLHTLNDPCAGNFKVERLVSELPVLEARCMQRAQRRSPRKRTESLSQALALIGNRGLETELLQLLEDLTCLKADLEDAASQG
jgi:hypothetical protein